MTKTRKKRGPNQSIGSLRISKGPKQRTRVSNLPVSLCPRPWEKPTGQYWSAIVTEGQGWQLNKADVLCVWIRVDVTPSRCNAFSQWGRVTALCKVGLEQRSSYSLHQQQKPKNSGREGGKTGTRHIRGGLADMQEILQTQRGFGAACQGKLPAERRTAYLFIVTQLVIKDDAIGLFWLRP